MYGKFTCLVLALGLIACAGDRPSAPTASTVEAPLAWRTDVNTNDQLSATWWQSFDDPGLTAIINSALARNNDIQIAATRIEEFSALAALAHAQQLPEVDGRMLYQRDRSINPAYGLPFSETLAEPVIAFSYDTDLFGRLRSATAAARANLLASQAMRADVQLRVAALTARDWFTLRSLDERLEILQKTLEARDRTRKLIARRVGAGYSAQLDLAQAEAEYHATQEQIPPIYLAIARTEDGLSVLLGDNPHAIDRPLAFPHLPVVPSALPSTLLRRRPDIVEAEERLVAADHSLDVSRAAFMPTLQLQGDWGQVTSTLLRNNPVDVFAVGASVLAPIFDAGRLKAAENISVARRNEAAWDYRKSALIAFAEVDDALAATKRIGERIEALEAQRSYLERALQIASQRYNSGYAPFLDQLDAERSLLAAQLAISDARADQFNAMVSLFQALGGGWDPAAQADRGKSTAALSEQDRNPSSWRR